MTDPVVVRPPWMADLNARWRRAHITSPGSRRCGRGTGGRASSARRANSSVPRSASHPFVGDLQRVGDAGERLHQRSELQAGLAGEIPGFSCRVDQTLIGERRVSRCIAQLHVRKQRWGQHADLIDGRCRSAEVQRVDDDATVRLGRTHHDLDGGCEIVGRPPGEELESDHEVVGAASSHNVAKLSIARLRSWSGIWASTNRAPSSPAQSIIRAWSAASSVGTDSRQLDVEDADAGRLSMFPRATDERGVGQQRRHFFVG